MSEYRSVMLRAEETRCIRSMGYEDQPALAHWGPGRRNYCILHYVTKGRGFFCGREVREGQGFFIDAGQLHEYHADEKQGWNYFWIILSPELAKEYVLPNVKMDAGGVFRAEYTGRIQRIRQRIFADRQPMGHLEALAFFFETLSMHESSAESGGSLPMAHVSGAKIFIENNPGRRLTVKEVAREVLLDDRYLYNLFMKYEGISPKEYIDCCRTENACVLLRQTALSVTQIAEASGYEDVCSFSKFFRKRTGASPTEYRRRQIKEMADE